MATRTIMLDGAPVKVPADATDEQVAAIISARQGGTPASTTRPDAANNPMPDSLVSTAGQKTTMAPAPTWAERAREYGVNFPTMAGGIMGNILGALIGKSPGAAVVGGTAGSAAGGAASEAVKQIENPMARGAAWGGPIGMGIEYLAEQTEQPGPTGEGIYEPQSNRSIGEAALTEGAIGGAGEVLGAMIPGGGQIAKRVIAPAAKDTAIKATASKLGLAGDVPANIQNRGWVPGLLSKMARLTEPGTNVLSQQVKRLSANLNTKLDSTIGEIAGALPVDPMTNRQFGEQVGKAIDAAETLTKAPISEQFEAIKEATAARMVEKQVTRPVPSPILSAQGMPMMTSEAGTEMVAEGGVWASTKGIKKAVQDAWGHIPPQDLHLPQNAQAKQLIDEYTNLPDNLTVNQLMEMRSDLLAKARKARSTSKLEAVEFSIAKDLDSTIETALEKSGMSDIAESYGTARAAWREASELFNNKHIDMVTKYAKERPEAVTHLLFSPGQISRTDAVVKALEKNNPQDFAKIMNTVRRDKFAQMRIKADGSNTPSARLAKEWFSLEPEQKDILAGNSIAHREALEDIFSLYKDLTPEEIAKKMGGDVGSLEQHSKVSAISSGTLAGLAGMAGMGTAFGTGNPYLGVMAGIMGYTAPAGLAKILASERATRMLAGHTRDLLSGKLLTAEAIVAYGNRVGRLVYQTESELGEAQENALRKTPDIDLATTPNSGAF